MDDSDNDDMQSFIGSEYTYHDYSDYDSEIAEEIEVYDGPRRSNKSKNRFLQEQIDQRDFVICRKTAKIGIPAPRYLGSKTTKETKHSKAVKNMIDFCFDPISKFFCLIDFPQTNVVVVFRFFYAHCIEYFSDSIIFFKEFSLFYMMFFNTFTTKTPNDTKLECYRLRNEITVMRDCIKLFGPAFLPKSVMYTYESITRGRKTIVEKTGEIYLHRIPLNKLLSAQTTFIGKKYNNVMFIELINSSNVRDRITNIIDYKQQVINTSFNNGKISANQTTINNNNSNVVVCSQLNGSNGEATNTDDVFILSPKFDDNNDLILLHLYLIRFIVFFRFSLNADPDNDILTNFFNIIINNLNSIFFGLIPNFDLLRSSFIAYIEHYVIIEKTLVTFSNPFKKNSPIKKKIVKQICVPISSGRNQTTTKYFNDYMIYKINDYGWTIIDFANLNSLMIDDILVNDLINRIGTAAYQHLLLTMNHIYYKTLSNNYTSGWFCKCLNLTLFDQQLLHLTFDNLKFEHVAVNLREDDDDSYDDIKLIVGMRARAEEAARNFRARYRQNRAQRNGIVGRVLGFFTNAAINAQGYIGRHARVAYGAFQEGQRRFVQIPQHMLNFDYVGAFNELNNNLPRMPRIPDLNINLMDFLPNRFRNNNVNNNANANVNPINNEIFRRAAADPNFRDIEEITVDRHQFWHADYHQIKDSYVAAGFPNVKSLFSFNELPTNAVNKILFDPIGDPFCGLTAIDLATRKFPSVERYLKLALNKRDVYDVGTNIFLRKYAHSRQCNLRIMVPNSADDPLPLTLDSMNDAHWPWIVLVVKNSDASYCNRNDLNDVAAIKHVWLVCDTIDNYDKETVIPLISYSPQLSFLRYILYQSIIPSLILLGCHLLFQYYLYPWLCCIMMWTPLNNIEIDVIVYNYKLFRNTKYDDIKTQLIVDQLKMLLTILMYFIDELIVFYHLTKLFSLSTRYVFVQYKYNNNLNDYRTVKLRRDAKESDDYYAEFNQTFGLWFGATLLIDLSFLRFTKTKLVSVIRAVACIKEAQLCDKEHQLSCVNSVLTSNFCSTNDNLTLIYLNTREYVLEYLKYVDYGDNSLTNSHTVCYNSLGLDSFLPKLQEMRLNQLLLTMGNKTKNGFLNKIEVPKNIHEYCQRKSKIIATNFCFSIHSFKQQLSCGIVLTTNFFSLISGLMGRAMSREQREDPGLRRFVEKSKRYMDEFLVTIDKTIDEIDCVEQYRVNNKGKKNANYIENRIKHYQEYLKSDYKKTNKFFNHSCFVKMEESVKNVNGTIMERPRIIMTMSEYFTISLSNLIPLIDQWNHSAFSRYQVKGLDSKEFALKIDKFCDRKHMVTDYSAFETSVNYIIREIENYVVEKLCIKNGFNHTLKEFRKLHGPTSRILKTKDFRFNINTRCSGDYITSFGNCIVNYCINRYSHEINNPNEHFTVICEGDDGLTKLGSVDETFINSLGFDFSVGTKGVSPGDVDFLRRRWIGDKCYLNIGRTIKQLSWVKHNNPNLSVATSNGILKCMAYSVYYMSKGHPVLMSVCKRIFESTKKYKVNINFIKTHFINNPAVFNKKPYEDLLNNLTCDELDFTVDESMRYPIALGAMGFPPISIINQLYLEKEFGGNNNSIQIFNILEDYEDIINGLKVDVFKPYNNDLNEQFTTAIKHVNLIIDLNDQELSYYYLNFNRLKLIVDPDLLLNTIKQRQQG